MPLKSFIILFITFLISSCSNQTIVYVASNKIIQGYHGTVVQHEIFQTKAKVWQQHVDSLITELQALSKTPSAHSIKEKQLLRYRDAIQQQAQQENQRMTKVVLNEINVYLKQYGKEKGYTFILGATEDGNIVYAAPGTDITEDVLKGLNEQYDSQHPSATH